ncbi:MAG: hypothetical protein JETCAE01_07190 [Anaerolineaceae bacterium]|nr:MAG: hypothetical protein JETCAE01_07190 [Anaerolineaceae bacterium]
MLNWLGIKPGSIISTVTDTQKRDQGLDILKGIGCALMIITHSKLKMLNYEEIIFWAISPWMWVVLLLLIFAASFAIPKPSYVSYFELLPGVAFAVYYPLLGRILKERNP